MRLPPTKIPDDWRPKPRAYWIAGQIGFQPNDVEFLARWFADSHRRRGSEKRSWANAFYDFLESDAAKDLLPKKGDRAA